MQIGLLAGAVIALVASIFLPYWSITLHAPQYPGGLQVQIYVDHLTGDVSEVDGLNHYIGMMTLEDAASFERTLAKIALPIIALLALASFWIPGRWKWLAVLPMVIYPIAFFVDLFIWLYYAGHSLDPNAALSNSIQEFTPRILGTGIIGQFSTEASFSWGFYLAIVASVAAIVATILARKSASAEQ